MTSSTVCTPGAGAVGVPEALTGMGRGRQNDDQLPQLDGTRMAAGEQRTKVEQMPRSQTCREVRRGQIKDFTT